MSSSENLEMQSIFWSTCYALMYAGCAQHLLTNMYLARLPAVKVKCMLVIILYKGDMSSHIIIFSE